MMKRSANAALALLLSSSAYAAMALALLLSSSAYAAVALEHSNRFAINAFYGVQIGGVDYLYGYTWSGSTYSIARANISTGAVSTVYSFAANVVIKCLWRAPDNSYQIIVVGDTNVSPTAFYLYRSTDNFQTVAQVQQVNGNLGQRNLCILSRDMPGASGSAGWLFYLDYGVGASGSVIGTRIYKSSDNGQTWTTIALYNSSGTKTHIAHFHGMWQDPYTGYVYVCAGDTDAENMLVRWDGSGSWTNDELPATFAANIASRPQFRIDVGSQIPRTVDMIFTSQAALTFSDSYASADVTGIWKWEKDLSGRERINNDIRTRGAAGEEGFSIYHVGWLAEQLNGTYVWTTMLDNAGQEPRIEVYTSTDAEDWQAVARFDLRDGSKAYMYSLFTYGGKIYASTVQSLIASWTTEEIVLNGTFNKYTPPEELTILHPVRYVGNWGVGTPVAGGPGYSKFAPAASLETVLEATASGSDSFRNGSRIRLAEGTHGIGDTYATWSTLASTSQSRGGYLIDGEGASATHLQIALSGNLTVQTGNASTTPLVLKSMEIGTLATSGKDLVLSASSYTKLLDCVLLPPAGSYPIFGNAGCNLEIVRSRINGLSSGVIQDVYVNGTSGVTGYLKARESVFYGGYRGIDFRGYGDSQLTVTNCVFAGTLNAGVQWQNTTDIPIVKNNIFYNCGTYSIYDSASLTETSDYIDHNDYYGTGVTKQNIAAGADAASIASDPKFVGYPDDMTPGSDSPCINAGVVVAGVHDKTPRLSSRRIPILTIPDIGAYEYAVQKLYFNASASGAVQNGTKAHPYDSFGDYAFTGCNLREGASLILAGALGSLDMSGLSDDGAISVKPEDGKTASLTGFASNGGAALPMSSGNAGGFLQSVLRFPHH
jgi:hypothetical protein